METQTTPDQAAKLEAMNADAPIAEATPDEVAAAQEELAAELDQADDAAKPDEKEEEAIPEWYSPDGSYAAWLDCTDLGFGRFKLAEPTMYNISQIRAWIKKTGDPLAADAMAEQLRAYVRSVEVLENAAGYDRAVACPEQSSKHDAWVAFYRCLPMRVWNRLDRACALLAKDSDKLGN